LFTILGMLSLCSLLKQLGGNSFTMFLIGGVLGAVRYFFYNPQKVKYHTISEFVNKNENYAWGLVLAVAMGLVDNMSPPVYPIWQFVSSICFCAVIVWNTSDFQEKDRIKDGLHLLSVVTFGICKLMTLPVWRIHIHILLFAPFFILNV